jgi:hypothetical protein
MFSSYVELLPSFVLSSSRVPKQEEERMDLKIDMASWQQVIVLFLI